MAKQKEKSPAPSSLTMDLNAPGMTAMHRAGLGGLAATLRRVNITRRDNPNAIKKEPWNEAFSWNIQPTTLTLNFGEANQAAKFLRWLFEFAFQIRDGLIWLPGMEGVEKPLAVEVQAQLQQGMLLTFLQHGQTRTLAGDEQTLSYMCDDKRIEYKCKPCSCYTHQSSWKDWVNDKGELVLKEYDVQGPVHPGAVVRHQAWTGKTKISQPLELILPLYFAIVGTLSISINRGTGVLIVPYVDNLKTFAKNRSRMTPMTIDNCLIGGVGDAALQFEVRCRADEEAETADALGCDVIRFRPMPWATQQKSRTETLSIDRLDSQVVEFYRRILGYFHPHVVTTEKIKKEGRGKNAVSETITENFWGDSVIRPFIAENLARGRLWFEGFARWLCSNEPASGQQYWKKIQLERKGRGLYKMVNDKSSWQQQGTPAGAEALVFAVQEALRRRYGAIADECKKSGAAVGNRFGGEYERWRLAFSGAKTAEQFRYALTDMFSRAKNCPPLREHWKEIIDLMVGNWELARDLALVGLASYAKKEGDPDVEQDAEQNVAE